MQVVDVFVHDAATTEIYTSDHGELFGAHGLLGKSSLYEASVGVPLILCGPSVPKNQVTDMLVSHVDLFPTAIDAAGARMLPADAELRGRSLFDTVDRRGP